jgi:hypothetical protein
LAGGTLNPDCAALDPGYALKTRSLPKSRGGNRAACGKGCAASGDQHTIEF